MATPRFQVFIGKVSATMVQPPCPVLEFGSFCCGAEAEERSVAAVFYRNSGAM